MNRPAAVLLCLLAACRTVHKPTTTPPRMPPPTDYVYVDTLDVLGFQYQWLQARARVSVRYEEKTTEFTAHVRARHDSAIWISLTPLAGIEAARLLLTRDSIRLMDRLGKKSLQTDYRFLDSLTSLPLTFTQVQNLLAGNLIAPASRYRLSRHDTLFVGVSDQQSRRDSVVFTRSRLLRFQSVTVAPVGQLALHNQQYVLQDNQPFALWRKWTIFHHDTLDVEITFNRIKLNEALRFPFRSEE